LTEIRFYVPFDAKIGHFGDVLSRQLLGIVLKKLNIAERKKTSYNTRKKASKTKQEKTHKMLNLNKRTKNKLKPN